MSSTLSASEKAAVSRIGGLVLINAMVFQEVLSESEPRVQPLQATSRDANPVNAFADHWDFIVRNINYYPIFHIGTQALLALTANHDVVAAVVRLAGTAQRIVTNRAALRHDLMGRVYHRLLADAKYLATYYTRIPSATLLMKLAMPADSCTACWHDVEELGKLRIADLACGTGTLLMAAADAIMDNYIPACAATGTQVNLAAVHKSTAENILYGYDVLPSALHLTASTIALRAPEVLLHDMKLFSLPHGGKEKRLGSIEFIEGGATRAQTGLFDQSEVVQQMGGKGKRDGLMTSLPSLDLCVMNPPFTRSAGENLLFGSAPAPERAEMQRRLKKIVSRDSVFANITAGLGSVFVAAAHPHIKPGGRIALVLPKTLLSGVAWDATRQLIRRDYHVDYIIVSSDPLRWNFSESTDLSEVMFVATKNDPAQPAANAAHRTVAINLWRNPSTPYEALAVAQSIKQGATPDLATGQGALRIGAGSEKMGEAVSLPWSDLRERYSWLGPCAFAQSDLVRSAMRLTSGSLWLPGHSQIWDIPLCKLSALGELGPDRRDIHDGFCLSNTVTPYAAVWGHDSRSIHTMNQSPNHYLSPLPTPKQGRNLRRAEDLWPRAGQVLLGERIWLYTQRLLALFVDSPVLSNVWWPFAIRSGVRRDAKAKAITLWLNSTLGLLVILSERQETRGAWVDFKKPVLSLLSVLDVEHLEAHQLDALASAYDRLCALPLSPFPSMATDDVRREIDSAITKTLGLPDISILRRMLSVEPIISLRRL